MFNGSGLIAVGLLFLSTLFYRGLHAFKIRVGAIVILMVVVGCYYVSLNQHFRKLNMNNIGVNQSRPEKMGKSTSYLEKKAGAVVGVIDLGKSESDIEKSNEGTQNFDDFTIISEKGIKRLITWEKPVLFFAEWCDHCEDVMRDISCLPVDQRPVFVSIYPDTNDPIQEISKAKQKARLAGLEVSVYVCFDDMSGHVETVPSLVVKADGKFDVIKNPKLIIKHLHGQ